MDECIAALQAVAKSTEELLAGQYNSLDSMEIKHSAGVLRSSVQPCLDELQRSTILLKSHLELCLQKLDAAEDVRQSKQRITEIPTCLVWENIGEISGYSIRVRELASELKPQITEQIKQIWLIQIEEVKRHCFWDSKNKQHKLVIDGDSKERFRRELPDKIGSVSKMLDKSIKSELQKIVQVLENKHLQAIQSLINVLDHESISEFQHEQIKWLAQLQQTFEQSGEELSSSKSVDLCRNTRGVVEEWRKRSGNISFQEVERFSNKVINQIQERVEKTVDDCQKMLCEFIEQVIAFYNKFLEQQNRYLQETPEQRQSEKIWIDWQRRQLQRSLSNLEAMKIF